MRTLKLIRGRDFLFFPTEVSISDKNLRLKWNSVQSIELPEGIYDLNVKLSVGPASAKTTIAIKDKENSVRIRQILPSSYYILGLLIMLILFVLSYSNIIPLWIFTIYLVIINIPLFYIHIVKMKSYCKFIKS